MDRKLTVEVDFQVKGTSLSKFLGDVGKATDNLEKSAGDARSKVDSLMSSTETKGSRVIDRIKAMGTSFSQADSAATKFGSTFAKAFTSAEDRLGNLTKSFDRFKGSISGLGDSDAVTRLESLFGVFAHGRGSIDQLADGFDTLKRVGGEATAVWAKVGGAVKSTSELLGINAGSARAAGSAIASFVGEAGGAIAGRLGRRGLMGVGGAVAGYVAGDYLSDGNPIVTGAITGGSTLALFKGGELALAGVGRAFSLLAQGATIAARGVTAVSGAFGPVGLTLTTIAIAAPRAVEGLRETWRAYQAWQNSRATAAALGRAETRQAALAAFAAQTGFGVGELQIIREEEARRAQFAPVRDMEERRNTMLLDARIGRIGDRDRLREYDQRDLRAGYSDAMSALMQPGGFAQASRMRDLQQAQGALSEFFAAGTPMFEQQRAAIDSRLNPMQAELRRLEPVDRLRVARDAEQRLRNEGGSASAIAANLNQQRSLIGQMGFNPDELSTNQVIARAVERRVELEQQSNQLLERRENLNAQERRHNIQMLEQRREIHSEMERFARQQAQALRQQQRGDESNFGLMDDEARTRVVNVSRRLRAFFEGNGEDNFTNEDLGIAQAAPQLRGAIEELGLRRARRDGRFAELEGFALPGQLNRPDQIRNFDEIAEQQRRMKVNLEQKIKVDVAIDADASADAIVRVLTPALEQWTRSVSAKIEEQFRINQANQANQNLLNNAAVAN